MQMSQPAYLRYESGDRVPSIHVVQTMADVLGTSAAYLTNESDDPRPDTYVIKSAEDAELFFLIEQFKSSNEDIKREIVEYAKKLAKL